MAVHKVASISPPAKPVSKIPAPTPKAQAKAQSAETTAQETVPEEGVVSTTREAHAAMSKLRATFIDKVNAYKAEIRGHNGTLTAKAQALKDSAEKAMSLFEELVNTTGMYPQILIKMQSNFRNIDKRLDSGLHTKATELKPPKAAT